MYIIQLLVIFGVELLFFLYPSDVNEKENSLFRSLSRVEMIYSLEVWWRYTLETGTRSSDVFNGSRAVCPAVQCGAVQPCPSPLRREEKTDKTALLRCHVSQGLHKFQGCSWMRRQPESLPFLLDSLSNCADD